MSELLGWTATVLFIVCYIPQIIKSRKSNELSMWLLIITFIANVIALAYATLIQQPPLQVKYLLTIIMLLITLYYASNFKSSNR